MAIFDPELSIQYTTYMELRRRLRVVLYWSIPMLKWFAAAKKLSPVKIKSVPKITVFRKF